MAALLGLRVGILVLSIEELVAQILVRRAVQAVSSGLEREVENRCPRIAIFGVEVASLKAELLNGVDGRLRFVEHTRCGVGRRRAVDADLFGEALQAVLAGDRPAAVVGIDHRPGNDLDESHRIADVIAEIERQAVDLVVADRSRKLRTLSLEHAGVGLHLDSLRELADLERDVDRRCLLHSHRDTGLGEGCEPLLGYRQVVEARRKFGDDEPARFGRSRFPREVGCRLPGLDGRARDGRSRWIGYGADDRSTVALGHQSRDETQR